MTPAKVESAVPTLPALAHGTPPRSSIAAVSSVVVVLPLVPVMPTIGLRSSSRRYASSTSAHTGITVKDAIYKGLAISTGPAGNWLYAANFHAGTIDVFNGTFGLVHWAGAFHDGQIPVGYAPFNIQNLGDRLYVTYAVQKADKVDDAAGAGHGFVDVYDLKGKLLKRLIAHGPLNSPWGLAMAPAGFGAFGGDLLVGNFGNGRISAFDPATGAYKGQLRNADGLAITIQGLWGLLFGNGVAGTPDTLFFTAGIAAEDHGLMGTITAGP